MPAQVFKLVGPAFAGGGKLRQVLVQGFQGLASVALDAKGVVIIAAQFRRVYIDLDDLLAAQPGGVGHSRAHGQDGVEMGLVFRNGVVAEALGAQGQRVTVGNSALALCRSNNRRLQVLGNPQQGFLGLRVNHPTTGPDQGIGRLRHNPGAGPHGLRVRCRMGVFLGLPQFHVGHFRQGFRRYFNLHRSRPASFQLVERLVDSLWHFRRVQDALGPLGYGPDGVQLIVDLVENAPVAADQVALNLAGNHQHG